MIDNKKLIPNSTQIPNSVLDLLIPDLPEAEGKCLLYICRRTFGFHKDEDRISFKQFINGIKSKNGQTLDKGTGLVRQSVSEGLKNLAKSGAIIVEKNSNGNIYRLNLEMDIEKVVQKIDQSRKQTASGLKNRPKQVYLIDPQKKGKQRETKVFADGASAHSTFIKFFEETTQRIRGIKPIITQADCRNLKRVLDFGTVSETELEQIALYFLSDRYYKKFSPAISTFLSAGILNGLVDSLKNRPTFWREMDDYMGRAFQRPAVQSDDLAYRLAEMKEKLITKK
ncbi:MAG: hypothetical protein COT92_01905 [Candidatus Doudnabacteria bacterium CG10_big_fil_rev_8_21_14_0_10_42_18]|uniref:Bacteriophage lambda Replication protein O N-terminal domain-containing protein n=1 Tax=Candidatus Doudnabacteria bacterium CG10_big_fil_rev_8_21_14_0_10_42_18 TaxID=1974552 RepID=A0A2H0VB14_9BACT|nr:MAG: hypothetical protein COT92_01905 [Candidatus Doudnabacteria bacterium CG10_big_fil_rev_8_21_14_0_10_42_18]